MAAIPPKTARVSHFDLMLQFGDNLRTWEMLRLPMEGEQSLVRRLPNHRLEYLDYEGPLTDNRGHVIGWERGKLVWNLADEFRMEILLFGQRLTAKLIIETHAGSHPTAAKPLEMPENWLLTAEIWQIQN